MTFEFMFGLQIAADVVLFVAIIFLLWVVNKEIHKKSHTINPETLNQFRKLLEESQTSAEYLMQTIDEGRKSLKELSCSLEEKEKKLQKLADKTDGIVESLECRDTPMDEEAERSNYHRVVDMATRGLSTHDIAKSLHMPEGEVSLILGLDNQKIENT